MVPPPWTFGPLMGTDPPPNYCLGVLALECMVHAMPIAWNSGFESQQRPDKSSLRALKAI